MLASKLLSAAGGTETLYVDDVFATFLYTGNGSTKTITNGIDLAGKGGLVWVKGRSAAYSNSLVDTVRGVHNYLQSNSSAAQNTSSATLTAFNANGFSVGNDGWYNNSGQTYASWTFRKAERFFDCGTYTGNGVAGRQIAHSLGVAPGMVIVKNTNVARDWAVWHRSLADATYLKLNTTEAAITNNTFNVFGDGASQTSTHFTVGKTGASGVNGLTNANASGEEYVWYAFAHDTSADGIVQCGSFTTDGSGNATVNLGWEPQFCMFKSSSGTSNWFMRDTLRGMVTDATSGPALYANLSDAEAASSYHCRPNATGMVFNLLPSTTYVYIAIRRPNKPPTTGTQVFAPAYPLDSIVPSHKTTFPVDLVIRKNLGGSSSTFVDRLRGPVNLDSTSTAAEVTDILGSNFAYMNGWGDNAFGLNTNAHAWLFRRATGVFDVVAYTGTGSARTVAHSLGVAPELMIVKRRSLSEDWYAWHAALGAGKFLYPNLTNATVTSANRFDTVPTATEFSAGSTLSSSSQTYIAYLWASMAGITKVGSYTGNGSSQTIGCGFSAGARFVLIKRIDSTGDWYVWDTVRGIVAGNDPHLSLNTTASEVTTNDSIDPDSTGFVVNQFAATNINVTSATYIYLAFA